MNRSLTLSLIGLAAMGMAACQEEHPTTGDSNLLPEEPITLEIEIPWDDFASELEVFGGYGAPWELGTGVVAKTFAEILNARTLVRFAAYPRVHQVRDTTGTTRPDSSLTFIGGRVVAFFDTIASTNSGAVELGLGATQTPWDNRTVTWLTAVDTLNDLRPWPQPGAGPVTSIGTTVWDPAEGDSAWFELDSVQVEAWADTADASRGARIESLTDNARLQVSRVVLRLDTRPSSNPDTVIVLSAQRDEISFVYDPIPEAPANGIRIGGAPAWRTVLNVKIPTHLDGPAELCVAAGGCPLELEPLQLNYAAITLKSERGEQAFQPTDSIGLDVRQVLRRDALPKAPLGESLTGLLGQRVGPDAFGVKSGTDIEIPITEFVRDLLDSQDGINPTKTLALLSVFEPISIAYASFHGPGDENGPVLRLVITVGRAMELP